MYFFRFELPKCWGSQGERLEYFFYFSFLCTFIFFGWSCLIDVRACIVICKVIGQSLQKFRLVASSVSREACSNRKDEVLCLDIFIFFISFCSLGSLQFNYCYYSLMAPIDLLSIIFFLSYSSILNGVNVYKPSTLSG